MANQPGPVPGHPVPGMHLWGWMAPGELVWLGEHAANMNSVVEVGSLRGRSAFALLTACKGTVYCIDPWGGDEGDNCYAAFMDGCGHFPNLVAIRDFSPAAGSRVPGPVEMTFIDGDHNYEPVKADVEYWLPRTTKLICGHDYNHGAWPGVRQAVHEYFEPRGYKINATSGKIGMWGVQGGASIWYVRLNGYDGGPNEDLGNNNGS